ncbi:MAG: hypothetical protein COW03_02810 [Cytophagales bacterium CG12_big_fil_rev_8_21_14_0_65_40_12]|nr:MAG: hypothetical protein COW03_02810 [Cytophagales bacterium CG12_big_fil_rev_8_21_14_0_65_40_12]PIW03474.1 MAG: hypothetical protein COW40_15055 [Cytophagales bacterium CG17_big_fil_post_rev_8_21_14_2_50_40_13]
MLKKWGTINKIVNTMSEFSDWFKDTFKGCYCEKGNLVDERRFSEIVQLVLDNEADEESRAIFEEKIRTCVKSCGSFEKEKSLRETIKQKLFDHKKDIPNDLAASIKKSINL